MIRHMLATALTVFLADKAWAPNVIPGNQLSASLVVQVDYDANGKEYLYKYLIKSNANSEQSIYSIWIIVEDSASDEGGTISWINGPTDKGWSAGSCGEYSALGVNVLSWFTTEPNDWDARPYSMIEPGQSLDGFAVKSEGLPSIQMFLAKGWVRDMTEQEVIKYFSDISGKTYTNLDMVPLDLYRNSPWGQPLHERAFQGKTVAPEVLLPDEMKPKKLLERLITLKDQSAELGWIKDPGTVTSLNQKLANALDALKRGNRKACRNILGAFMQELDAQKDKHINSNAYYLFKVNAEYIANEALKAPWYWPF